MAPTRVQLADDHAWFREGLAAILAAQPDFVMVAEAGDGRPIWMTRRVLLLWNREAGPSSLLVDGLETILREAGEFELIGPLAPRTYTVAHVCEAEPEIVVVVMPSTESGMLPLTIQILGQ